MTERPALDKHLDSKTFRDFYYLKEELIDFCRKNGLPVSGGKLEIADRIAYFLDTGKVLSAGAGKKKAAIISSITKDTEIETDFVCSERHRAFLKSILETVFLLM
ncbi:MAG: SAP domain-containing protein [[Clostridium] scindens]